MTSPARRARGMDYATLDSMKRVRISTTVDADSLANARALLKSPPDSVVMDQALTALIEHLEGEHELAALEKYPYHQDPDLNWVAPQPPTLPYDGEIPAHVQALADERRRRKGK